IRTLGEDIGQALGCGAHLAALRRLATGPFDESQCLTLAQLEALDDTQRLAALLPPEVLLRDHVRVTLSDEEAGRFLSGLRRRGAWPDAERVAVHGQEPDALLGTAHIKAGELIPTRLLSPLELRQMLTAPIL
ncbi:MAG TPA: tRNA pseudouridine(55) synthase TruB, partial [Ottowia sp.]|nr:tRNA pseudouridine(55) synthase TruB [Ottowia sp.]